MTAAQILKLGGIDHLTGTFCSQWQAAEYSLDKMKEEVYHISQGCYSYHDSRDLETLDDQLKELRATNNCGYQCKRRFIFISLKTEYIDWQ